MPSHEALNQVPPLEDLDLYAADPALAGLVAREGGGGHDDALHAYGTAIGSADAYRWGFEANRHGPQLRTHDRSGRRIDQVDFHPSWHQLMKMAVSHRTHSLPWVGGPGGFVARAAQMTMMAGVEAGHGCPISMTAAVVPALRHQPDLAAEWEPRLTSSVYDPRFVPVEEKQGALMGMGMTEKQGGSDVRANITTAVEEAGGWYRINGHKWFTSAPMCDAFLILAQAPGGLSCFFLPRHLPDGSVNSILIQRLKDKLGNRSNASAELEFVDARARLVGEEGRGVATIIDMVNGTRLDCVSGSAGLMRQAVMQAAHHCVHRSAFGSPLLDKPAMQNVLADMEVETQAATVMMTRLAGAFDRSGNDEREALVRRLLTPVAKYWVTKRCSLVTREALECLGGNGYVEESLLPRIFRESPLNAIWEGSGNVIALDVVRVAARHPQAMEALREELERHRGAERRFDAHLDSTWSLLAAPTNPEAQARLMTEKLALATQAALLIERASPTVADAFLSSRIGGRHGGLLGTLDPGLDLAGLAKMAVPR